jgi:hypothetical protein
MSGVIQKFIIKKDHKEDKTEVNDAIEFNYKPRHFGKVLVTAGGSLAFIATVLYVRIEEVSPAIHYRDKTFPAQYMHTNGNIPWLELAFSIAGIASVYITAIGLKKILRDNKDDKDNKDNDIINLKKRD